MEPRAASEPSLPVAALNPEIQPLLVRRCQIFLREHNRAVGVADVRCEAISSAEVYFAPSEIYRIERGNFLPLSPRIVNERIAHPPREVRRSADVSQFAPAGRIETR